MQILTGTSGFSYTAWRGAFYPEKLPEAQMLGYYAERLAAVEINNTFYRMPTPEQLGRWASETPAGFRFALKSPRQITHIKKLAEVADAVERLSAAASTLGERLGPILFQLPPFLKKDLPRLEAFLATLPPSVKAAIEFRHESWFTDDVYAALKARNAALCVADSEELSTPFETTASWGYLRLRRQDYDDAALASWGDRLRGQPLGDTYVFFKHEDEGRGAALASAFAKLMK
jgi:uncharacterized protein YecE (DUF72 family)